MAISPVRNDGSGYRSTYRHVYRLQDQRKRGKNPREEIEPGVEASEQGNIHKNREEQQQQVDPHTDTEDGVKDNRGYESIIEGLRRGPMGEQLYICNKDNDVREAGEDNWENKHYSSHTRSS